MAMLWYTDDVILQPKELPDNEAHSLFIAGVRHTNEQKTTFCRCLGFLVMLAPAGVTVVPGKRYGWTRWK